MLSDELFFRMVLVFGSHRDPVDEQILIDPGDDLSFVGGSEHVVSGVALANEAAWFGPVPKHGAEAAEECAVTSRAELLT